MILEKMLKMILEKFLNEENMLFIKDRVMQFLKEKAADTKSPVDDHVVRVVDQILDDLIRALL